VAIAAVIVGAWFLARNCGWIDPEAVRERADMTDLDRPAVYLGGAVFWITANSLMEEYVWRWFVFRQFERLVGGRWAVFLAAFGFTVHHIVALAGQFDWRVTALGSFGVFVGGVVWSWLYRRYQSVWPCWASHAIVDVPIFVIGWFLIFG
jgi:membrane protease YdiL (CAAX protease family)